MRRIVIDVRMIGSSGIGTYVSNLVPLIIQDRMDLRFYLLGSKKAVQDKGWDQWSNVEVVNLTSRMYSLDEQLRLAAGIPRGADLFWSPHYNVPLLYRGKLLVTVHDVAHLALPRFFKGLHKRLYARVMFGAVRIKADRVLCDSEFTKNEMVRLVGIDADRVEVVGLGVDESWFHLKQGDSPRPRPYLIYLGNVKPHKNLSVLLRAFRLLLDRIQHDLVIVGETEGFVTGDRETMRVAGELSDRIVVTGRVTDQMVAQFVANADALVLPSLYEGFGLPPLEAMACGCPALVSTAGSLPEVCGDAALYFDPHDERDVSKKILSVLEDSKLRADLIERGKRRARRFSWLKTTEATLKVIDDMLKDD